MAAFKYDAYLSKNQSNEFDKVYNPGTAAPYSGIYRCMGCHREVASNQNQPLPPQNHHQHSTTQGTVRWRLIAYADHNPK